MENSHPNSRFERPRHIKLPPALSLATSHMYPTRPPVTQKSSPTTYSLILHHLHRDIFKSPSDILPLLEPFGVVQRIRIVSQQATGASGQSSSDTLDGPTPTHKTVELPIVDSAAEKKGSTADKNASEVKEGDHVTAMAEFGKRAEAVAAKESIDGQVYGAVVIRAEFGAEEPEESPSALGSWASYGIEEEEEDDGDRYHNFRGKDWARGLRMAACISG